MRRTLGRGNPVAVVGFWIVLASIVAAHGQTFPVRFDAEPAAGENAAVTAERQILDAYVQRVTVAQGDSSTETVPFEALISRCGDRDGCRLRLFVANAGSALPEAQLAGLFAVDAAGERWNFWTYDGAKEGDGDSSDNTSETIVQLFQFLAYFCEFQDKGVGAKGFRLQVVSSSSGLATDCLLRIDD